MEHEDIIVEILMRLPVKSLLRFQSVCKRWKSLISSYSLRKLHRQRHTSSPPLLVAFHSSESESDDQKLLTGDERVEYYLTTYDLYGEAVQQYTLPFSSDIWLLTFPSQSKLMCFIHETSFYSYNPTTRQNFRLPDPPSSSTVPDSDSYYFLNLGYGYIQSRDEYILLFMNESEEQDGYWFCEILTFSISDDNFQLHYNEWRSIKVTKILDGFDFDYDFDYEPGLFVCRAFYWDGFDKNDDYWILSFDVETETFSTFEFPQQVSLSARLMELKDELYLLEEKRKPPTLDLWKLFISVNGNKTWTLHRKINLTSLGYTKFPGFDSGIFITKLEYLDSYNDLQKIGKMVHFGSGRAGVCISTPASLHFD